MERKERQIEREQSKIKSKTKKHKMYITRQLYSKQVSHSIQL